MKILITGGAGYVGTELTRFLTPRPEVTEVIIYDNLSSNHFKFFLGKHFPAPQKIKFVQGDILDSRRLKKEMKQADVVVHLAAKVTTPFANTDPHIYEQVNHWGTAEVVYAAEELKIKKLIYLSSSSVYGANTEPATEETQPAPSTYYGISKLRGEEHVSRLMGLSIAIILRAGNVFGYSPCMRFDAVINRFMFDANFTNRIQIFGSGKQTRAFIHIQKLAHSVAETIIRPVPNGIYNVVDKNLQILELLDAMKELYPSLEFIFSNQHMHLRELNVSPQSRLFEHIPHFDIHPLLVELREFRKHFAY